MWQALTGTDFQPSFALGSRAEVDNICDEKSQHQCQIQHRDTDDDSNDVSDNDEEDADGGEDSSTFLPLVQFQAIRMVEFEGWLFIEPQG